MMTMQTFDNFKQKVDCSVNLETGEIRCNLLGADVRRPNTMPFAEIEVNGAKFDVYFPEYDGRIKQFAAISDEMSLYPRVAVALMAEIDGSAQWRQERE